MLSYFKNEQWVEKPIIIYQKFGTEKKLKFSKAIYQWYIAFYNIISIYNTNDCTLNNHRSCLNNHLLQVEEISTDLWKTNSISILLALQSVIKQPMRRPNEKASVLVYIMHDLILCISNGRVLNILHVNFPFSGIFRRQ